MQSAEQQVLASIDELLAGQEDALVIPYSKVNKAVADLVTKNAKIVARMTDKILRRADRETVDQANGLDAITTRVLAGLDNWMYNQEYMLGQLAAKGGLTKAGAPLETALLTETTQAGQLAYQGTLVLAVREAVPYLEQLIEVLREIRDRMPGLPVRMRGETPATSEAISEESMATYLQAIAGAAHERGN